MLKNGVLAGTYSPFPPRTQLNDALIESQPDSRFGQFSLGLGPLWAWVCRVLDSQDSIKELMNCVLALCDRSSVFVSLVW